MFWFFSLFLSLSALFKNVSGGTVTLTFADDFTADRSPCIQCNGLNSFDYFIVIIYQDNDPKIRPKQITAFQDEEVEYLSDVCPRPQSLTADDFNTEY